MLYVRRVPSNALLGVALLGMGCFSHRVDVDQARPYLTPVAGEPEAFLLHTRLPQEPGSQPQALDLRREGSVLVLGLRMKAQAPAVDPRRGVDGALYAFTIDAGVQAIAYGDTQHLLWTRSGGFVAAPIGATLKTLTLEPKPPAPSDQIYKF